MFCKYCGNQVADDATFCSKCGKRLVDESMAASSDSEGNFAAQSENQNAENFSNPAASENQNNSTNSNSQNKYQTDSVSAFGRDVAENFSRMNPFCIVSAILTVLSFFVDFVGIFAYGALVFSIVGYKSAKKYNEKGKMGAIICICFSAIFTLAQVIMQIMSMNEWGTVYLGGIVSLFS